MADENYKRKLTAILSADVVGYSLLMADNELSTVAILKSYKETMTSLIKEHTTLYMCSERSGAVSSSKMRPQS